MKVEGFFTNEKIVIAAVIQALDYKVVKREMSFVLFKLKETSYAYFKDYGGIAFLNIEKVEQQQILQQLGLKLTESEDSLTVVQNVLQTENNEFDTVSVKEMNDNVAHILCLNLAQSAALFHYQALSDKLLEDTRTHTSNLERYGKFSIRKRNLLKYIGSTLNIKNKIAENLYIFDTPMFAWQDESIHQLDHQLNDELELEYRYNAVKEQLNIVQENLDMFLAIHQHEHSSTLEWIIIILILFEIVQVLIEKLF